MNQFIIIFILLTTTLMGQEISFDIHNKTLQEYLKFEKEIGSKRLALNTHYISLNGDAQPITFLRKQKIIPDLIVYYFFKEKDSSMSYILYEWDVSNFEKKDNNKKSRRFQKAMISKYSDLKEKISEKFGPPLVKKNYSNIARLDSLHIFEEESRWKNDSLEIKLYTTVSNFYKKEGAITINPVHRIRLYIKKVNKQKKSDIPELNDRKINELDETTNAFFQALKEKDLSKAKKYLSNRILDKVTDKQILALTRMIRLDKKTELINTGLEIGFNGKVYVMFQYKYVDDHSKPPKEIIKVLFDNNNKIIGIQPVKLIHVTK